MLSKTDIENIIQKIILVSDPEQIILFGSYATNSFDTDSDLDLLII